MPCISVHGSKGHLHLLHFIFVQIYKKKLFVEGRTSFKEQRRRCADNMCGLELVAKTLCGLPSGVSYEHFQFSA